MASLRLVSLCTLLFGILAVFHCAQGVTRGVVELDDVSWSRIVDGSKPVLVAFTEFGWKDPKDFIKVSDEFKDSEVIIAKVDTSKNEELKKTYDITTYPTFKFFPKGDKNNVQAYSGPDSAVDVIDFVRIQQSPSLKLIKDIAKQFIQTPPSRAEFLKKAEILVDTLSGQDKEYGAIYTSLLKKIVEKGDDFITKQKRKTQWIN